jgi:4-amino-4-deoxy-L-arabinose transferase-like glycosyltransferase
MATVPPVDPNAPRADASTLRTTSRRHLLLLLAIIALAVGLRVAWIAYVNPSPFDGRTDDTAFYAFAGKSLAEGKGYTNFYGFPTAQWPPAYPFMLAASFKAFGDNIVIPKIANALAGGLACLLIYLIAAKVFDRRIGLLAAFLFAVLPGQIYFSTLLMTESLTPALVGLMLLLLLMWVVERKEARWYQHAAIGVLFGVALLARGEAVMLVLAALLIWKLAVPAWRLFARQAGVFLVAAALTVMPWTIRNAISMHAFVPVSTALGHTMLAGHQPDIYSPWRLFPETKYQEQYKDVPFPEREIKVENASTHAALTYIVHHPVEESYYPFIKFYHLFKSDAEAVPWVNSYMPPPDPRPKLLTAQQEDRFMSLANVYYVLLMVCAAIGLPFWFSFRDKRKLLLMLFAGAWIVIHLALWPSGRYHVALMPIFCLWAALSLVTVYDWLIAQRRRVVAAAAASRGTARRR